MNNIFTKGDLIIPTKQKENVIITNLIHWTEAEKLGISVSQADKDMDANGYGVSQPNNLDDKWFVNEDYMYKNYKVK